MYPRRLLGFLVLGLALGCSRSGPDESVRPQDLILGCWESNDAGIEFTPSGSVLVLEKGGSGHAQYRFLDERTIEIEDGQSHKVTKLTGVSVSRNTLSCTSDDGRTLTLQRVKAFSDRIRSLSRPDVSATATTPRGPNVIQEQASPRNEPSVEQQRPKPTKEPRSLYEEPKLPPDLKSFEATPANKQEKPLKKPSGG